VIAVGFAAALVFWIAEAAIHLLLFHDATFFEELVPRDADEMWMRLFVCALFIAFGAYAQRVVNRLKRSQRERERLTKQLEETLTKALSGYVPICAACKGVRTEDDHWVPVDAYITDRTDATFSHTVCPTCAEKLYPGYT